MSKIEIFPPDALTRAVLCDTGGRVRLLIHQIKSPPLGDTTRSVLYNTGGRVVLLVYHIFSSPAGATTRAVLHDTGTRVTLLKSSFSCVSLNLDHIRIGVG
jgi:hypothetical protein